MSIVYIQSFCRVYQASGKGSSLYLTVTDYTPFGVLGQTSDDAVVLHRLFTLDHRAWPIDDNEEQLLASTQRLLELVEREQVALVIFGHDGEQWQTLKKAPMYYE